MRHILYYIAAVALTLGVASCSEEELTASTEHATVPFPQGNDAVDKRIEEFYRRTGTQLIYDYNDDMMRWQITDQLGYVSHPADKQYVNAAIDEMDRAFFSHFTDDKLRSLLPFRIYISSDLGRAFEYYGNDATGNYVHVRDTIWNTAATNGFCNVTFGMANHRLGSLSADSLALVRGEFAAAILSYDIENNIISMPEDFIKSSPMGVSWGNFTGSGGYNENGLLEYVDAKGYRESQDLAIYIKWIIAYPMSQLLETVGSRPFDSKGKIRPRLQTVEAWLKQIGCESLLPEQ